MTSKKTKNPIQIPLRNWHKLPDGTVVDKAYENCMDYFKNGEITGNRTCHSFCVDSTCCEESEGKPCCLIRYSSKGIKSLKIQFIYFKHSPEIEAKMIETIKSGVYSS